jgi:hypothetical protein
VGVSTNARAWDAQGRLEFVASIVNFAASLVHHVFPVVAVVHPSTVTIFQSAMFKPKHVGWCYPQLFLVTKKSLQQFPYWV